MNTEAHVRIVQEREDVEVHLADGRVLSGRRGAPLSEFLAAVDFPVPVVAADVDGQLRELTFPIRMEANVRPIDMSDSDGALIYRRSLNFLLEMAFADHFPGAELRIDHSISFGGYYCQVNGRPPLREDELSGLRSHMQELVDEDIPFFKKEVPLTDAIAYFKSVGYTDKIRLLNYRRKDYLSLYSLRDRMDYHHGYMVPSTGYLKWFELVMSNGGFTLRFPRRQSPTNLEPITPYPQLLAAFRLYGDWLEHLGIDNVGALNDAIHGGRVHEIVLVSEALHEQNIADIAKQVKSRAAPIVLIAGPTSSGKTTFSRRLTIQLLALGVSPYTLELDNYFVARAATPAGEDGKPDFEALEALDLKSLARDLQQLLAAKPVRLPHYNFETGISEPGEQVQLRPGQPVIMEGIHGLNPRLLPESLGGLAFKVYVSALTQLNLDRHNRVSTTDTRLLRRIVRDTRERGYSARDTIGRWESVRRGEKRYIFPYQERADVMFNSALVYELSALKPYVEPLLRQVPQGVPEFIEAKRLLTFLEWFLPIDATLIPGNSIVREFLGGSILTRVPRLAAALGGGPPDAGPAPITLPGLWKNRMSFIEVLLLGVSMAVDAFAVCLAAGSYPSLHGPRPVFRLAFHFGLFQFLMPVIGWLAGSTVEPFIRDIDHWVAFVLLAFVGGRMIYGAQNAERKIAADPSRGWTLVLLSIAVSIDALAVGLSLGVLGISVGYPALFIGISTAALSLVGLRLGETAGRRLGKPVEIVGGLVLIAIGVRIVVQHVML